MKEDQLFIVLLVSLFAILMLGLIPRSPTSDISGASVSSLAASDSTGAAIAPASGVELVAVAIIILVGVAGLLFFLLKKSQKQSFKKLISGNPTEFKQPTLPIEKPKTHEHTLHNYVQHSLAQGKSSSQVRHALMAVGWPAETIEKVMKKL